MAVELYCMCGIGDIIYRVILFMSVRNVKLLSTKYDSEEFEVRLNVFRIRNTVIINIFVKICTKILTKKLQLAFNFYFCMIHFRACY